MRLNCGDEGGRVAAVISLFERCWHRRFAWLPRRVAPRDCRWLEAYERRLVSRSYVMTFSGPSAVERWEYRPANPTTTIGG